MQTIILDKITKVLLPPRDVDDKHAMLFDCEYISLKNSKTGIAFKFGVLIVNDKDKVIFKYTSYIAYDLSRYAYSRYIGQIRWLKSNQLYSNNFPFPIKLNLDSEYAPITFGAAKYLLRRLIKKYNIETVSIKGISATDCLFFNHDTHLTEIEGLVYQKYEGVHDSISELEHYVKFLSIMSFERF